VGRCQCQQRCECNFEAQGLVVDVKIKVGDYVKAGTVLFQIDDVIMQSNLASSEINYLKAKRDFERSETLYQEIQFQQRS